MLTLPAVVQPQLAYGEAQALDRVMYEEEVRREALSFEQQFHYGAGCPKHL